MDSKKILQVLVLLTNFLLFISSAAIKRDINDDGRLGRLFKNRAHFISRRSIIGNNENKERIVPPGLHDEIADNLDNEILHKNRKPYISQLDTLSFDEIASQLEDMERKKMENQPGLHDFLKGYNAKNGKNERKRFYKNRKHYISQNDIEQFAEDESNGFLSKRSINYVLNQPGLHDPLTNYIDRYYQLQPARNAENERKRLYKNRKPFISQHDYVNFAEEEFLSGENNGFLPKRSVDGILNQPGLHDVKPSAYIDSYYRLRTKDERW